MNKPKKKTIVLVDRRSGMYDRTSHGHREEKTFKVDSLKNSTEYIVGSWLSENEVNNLISSPIWEVKLTK